MRTRRLMGRGELLDWLARERGLSRWRAGELIRAGAIPHTVLPGMRRKRFWREDVEAALDALGSEGDSVAKDGGMCKEAKVRRCGDETR